MREENQEQIPVNYKGKIVGYTYGEEGPLHFNNPEEAKAIFDSLNKTIFISSRGVATINNDGFVENRKVTSFDIMDDKKILYLEIEHLIIKWNNDGTKTAGSLTREIMELIKSYNN